MTGVEHQSNIILTTHTRYLALREELRCELCGCWSEFTAFWPPALYAEVFLGEIHSFSFKKVHLKMSSAKGRLFSLGLNVLKDKSSDASITHRYLRCLLLMTYVKFICVPHFGQRFQKTRVTFQICVILPHDCQRFKQYREMLLFHVTWLLYWAASHAIFFYDRPHIDLVSRHAFMWTCFSSITLFCCI